MLDFKKIKCLLGTSVDTVIDGKQVQMGLDGQMYAGS